MIGKVHKITKISLQILAPPEGNSSILEVCDQDGMDFIHISKSSENQFEITLLKSARHVSLSLSLLEEIIVAAKKNVTYVDISDYE